MLDQATRLREIAEQYCERPRVARPYIISVVSGKGGVGKSTIALNVAILLAESGNRILVLDADENLGNIDVMMGISPAMRLGQVLSGERDIEDVLVSPIERLSILPGNSGDTKYRAMNVERQKELLNDIAELEPRFDYLVIDTSAGIGDDIVNFALHSDETLIITNPEPTSVMDAYAVIKMISLADPLVYLKLIVNNERAKGEGEETARKLRLAVKHFLDRDIVFAGSMPFDAHVTEAAMKQSPLATEYPLSGASLALGVIAGQIVENAARVNRRRVKVS